MKLWDVEMGVEVLSLVGHADRVQAVAFAPDGRTLVTSGGDPRRPSGDEVLLWRAGAEDE